MVSAMVPMRYVFRSRWAALAWAAGICWTAVSFAGGGKHADVNAANSADGNLEQLSALADEDGD